MDISKWGYLEKGRGTTVYTQIGLSGLNIISCSSKDVPTERLYDGYDIFITVN